MELDDDLKIKVLRIEATYTSRTRREALCELFDYLAERRFAKDLPKTEEDCENLLRNDLSQAAYDVAHSRGWLQKVRDGHNVYYSVYLCGDRARQMNARNKPNRLPTMEETRNWSWGRHRIPEWKARFLEMKKACSEKAAPPPDKDERGYSGAPEPSCPEMSLNGIAIAATTCVFRRENQIWTLSFEGKTVHMSDTLGLGYIAELLRTPRSPIEATVLSGARYRAAQLAISRGLEVADETAINAVQVALAGRQAELAGAAENDWPKRGKLTQEISELEKYLAEAKGHLGQARKVAGTAQRSRSSVTNAINRAIKSIAANHPALGLHLDKSIRRGSTPMYVPAEVPDWQF